MRPPRFRPVSTAAVLALVSALLVPLTATAADAHGRHHHHDQGHGRGDAGSGARHSLRTGVTDGTFYFVMGDRFANGDPSNDTGGLGSDPLVSGFDPTRKGFYNGGDLKGLQSKLDYVKGLGADSIWLTPIFQNKAVQLEDGPSAGYHGYWITDFTKVDPHLGTNQDLAKLVGAAHAKGLKVYFDIITNHTADVIGYQEGDRTAYVSKDAVPYRDAKGKTFDDRDFAGRSTFPELDPSTSFPYHPVLAPGEEHLKKPDWLNDVTLYHNRGNTTFTGEDSQYGDFFGLDDLFTENPRVVNGMTNIYKTWVGDFGIDGFRIDTMKHVNDEFWQRFGPGILSYAHRHGKPNFFMFGEVALDGSGASQKSFTSHYTTHDDMQAILDFPFQDAARNFASRGQGNQQLARFFANDDWYTDADSNAYELPTFLGNHDMGRIGYFLTADNPGADESQLLQRDELAHELMYFSRGNPVVYYGDEQGFTGTGGDQLARQTMFASQVPEYKDPVANNQLGTDRTPAQDNFVTSHPLYQKLAELAALTRQHPALRNGAEQVRYASDGPGVFAFSRLDRKQQHEYVVALNNSTQEQSATFETFVPSGAFSRVYGTGADSVTTTAARRITVTVPALSSVVYRSDARIPASRTAPSISLEQPAPSDVSRSRMHVAADVGGSSFYEVTFQQKAGHGRWTTIGTDDSAPYQVFPDTSAYRTGTHLLYRAVVLDDAGHTRPSQTVSTSVPAPLVTIGAPKEGSGVRDRVEVQATVDPEKASHVVSIQRQVDGESGWTTVGTDSSSPVYTAVDSLASLGLAKGTLVHYRAVLHDRDGTTATSATRTVHSAGNTPATMATLHYYRPAGDYGVGTAQYWGLHMWGDAVDPAVLAQIDWTKPWPATRVSASGWAEYDIPLQDDTKPVNFIMHLPGGDTVPTSREPGGDRSFLPLDATDVYIVQGDPTVYTSKPAGTP